MPSNSDSGGGGGQYRAKTVHTYQGTKGNPTKRTEETDWWAELCKKHKAKNHWKKKKK